MQTVKSLKDLDSSNHARLFTRLFESIPCKISFNPRWATNIDQMDLSKIILDPENRIILQPGDMLACNYERKNSKHDRRKGSSREVLNSPVVLFGTPYGAAVVHYLYACKFSQSKTNAGAISTALTSLQSGAIHMTEPLRQAVMRLLERKPFLLEQITDPKVRKNIDIETFAKFFLLTEDFMKEIDEQAEFERAAGMEVSDGFPPIPKRAEPRTPDRRRNSRRPVLNKDDKRSDKASDHCTGPAQGNTMTKAMAIVSAPLDEPAPARSPGYEDSQCDYRVTNA